jgi:type III secretory pathway component EscU
VSVHRRPLVSRVLWRPAACRPWLVGLGLEICALAIAAAVAWPLATASADEQALAPARLAPLGAIAFAIVVVVVAADLATSYLFFLSDARMSRADLVEERRETQPPPQVLRRRSRRFSRRRS